MNSPRLSTMASVAVAMLAMLTLATGCSPSGAPGQPSEADATQATTLPPTGGSQTPPDAGPTSTPPGAGGETPTETSHASSAAGTTATTVDIEISLYPDGTTLGAGYTLHCDGADVLGQSRAPDPAAACAAIAGNPQLLTPGQPTGACTEIYGGPDRAVVTGTVNGREISTEFSRSNGCRIAQWDALQALLGTGNL